VSKLSQIISVTLAAAASVVVSGPVFAHAGFSGERSGASTTYVEGKSAYLQLNIGHDCSDTVNGVAQHYPVEEVTVMLPQGHSLSRIAKPVAGQAPQVIENGMDWAVTSGLPRNNATFRTSEVRTGAVHPSGDGPRAFVWRNGKLLGDHYEGFEFKVTLPKFPTSACVNKAVLYFPSVQYCSNGKAEAWTLKGSSFDSTLGDANGAAASITVARDETTNKLPEGCTTPETWYFYPATADVDQFLKASGTASQGATDLDTLLGDIRTQNADRPDREQLCRMITNGKKGPMKKCLAKADKVMGAAGQ
jgi:uncharacterized protein YcnI